MALTKDYRETIKARIQQDPAFRKALLQQGVECLLAGEADIGKAMLRDHIDATIGFEELARVSEESSESLERMFKHGGNHEGTNFFAVIQSLLEQEGIRPEDIEGGSEWFMAEGSLTNLKAQA